MPYFVTEFSFPVTEFNKFVITALTKKPTKPTVFAFDFEKNFEKPTAFVFAKPENPEHSVDSVEM